METQRTFIICGGKDCKFYRDAEIAATKLFQNFPTSSQAPILHHKPTTNEFQQWLKSDELPTEFKDVIPPTHTTSPACMERKIDGTLVYLGGYQSIAKAINLAAGGKLIAPTGRNDRIATCISWIVFIVHVLMLFFFNSSIGWRWTVSQTGAGAMWTTLQLAYDS